MTCPDRMALFIGLEEGDEATRAHLESCPACRAVAESERDLSEALYRLRDPAPPAELLAASLRRVEEDALLARRIRVQTAAILAGLCSLLATCFVLAGPGRFVGSALDLAGGLSAARTAAMALGHAVGPQLARLAVPMIAAQVLALVLSSLFFHRLVAAARVRS